MTDHNDITDILTDRDQILMAAWTLPNEGELTIPQRMQAMGNFTEYLKRNDLKIDFVIKQLGSPKYTTIRDLKSGVYRDKADLHIRKLNNWIEQHARTQAASIDDDFVLTGVAKSIQASATILHENATMGLVYGPSGIGKSRCAEALHQEYVGSILLRVIRGRHHPQGLTRAIAKELGLRIKKVYLQTLLEQVIESLQNSNRMIIIDEAGKLNDASLELLRDIYDTTGVPILLLSVVDLHNRILRTAGPDHGQLYSRFDVVKQLTRGKDFNGGDRKKLFSVSEIKQLYEKTPIRLASDAVRYLQDVANTLGEGSLRTCKRLLQTGIKRARQRTGVVDGGRVTVTASDLDWVAVRLKVETGELDKLKSRHRRVSQQAATG